MNKVKKRTLSRGGSHEFTVFFFADAGELGKSRADVGELVVWRVFSAAVPPALELAARPLAGVVGDDSESPRLGRGDESDSRSSFP